MHYASIVPIFLMLCIGIPLFQGCTNQAPKVIFSKREHQFPEPFIVGSEIFTNFSFTNEGSAPLHIQKIDSDCGCIATNTSSDKIPPGGRGKIRVAVDRGIGRFHQNVFVSTDDPAMPLVRLEVSGVILPPIASPKRINLGQHEKGEPISKKITFTNNLKNVVEITGHSVSNKSLVITLPQKTIPTGKSMEFEAVLTPNDVGSYSELLTFSAQTQDPLPSTDSNTFELSIQFQGRVLGGIVVLPQNLFLGVLDSSGKSIQRNVHIKTDGSLPFVLTKVAAEGFSVAAALSQTPQTAHDIQLSITPKPGSLSSGLVEGTIQIFTTHPDVPHITIPLKAVRQ